MRMGKGHVLNINLHKYRQYKILSERLDSLGGQISNMGNHADANALWALSRKYAMKAQDLRADIPDVSEGITE